MSRQAVENLLKAYMVLQKQKRFFYEYKGKYTFKIINSHSSPILFQVKIQLYYLISTFLKIIYFQFQKFVFFSTFLFCPKLFQDKYQNFLIYYGSLPSLKNFVQREIVWWTIKKGSLNSFNKPFKPFLRSYFFKIFNFFLIHSINNAFSFHF